MDGHTVGGLCVRSADEAAALACSSISGSSAAGVLSCESPAVSVTGLLTYTLNVDDANGRTSRAVSVQLQECEPFDLGTLSPLVWAWVVAMVAVLGTRWLYTRIFGASAPT